MAGELVVARRVIVQAIQLAASGGQKVAPEVAALGLLGWRSGGEWGEVDLWITIRRNTALYPELLHQDLLLVGQAVQRLADSC